MYSPLYLNNSNRIIHVVDELLYRVSDELADVINEVVVAVVRSSITLFFYFVLQLGVRDDFESSYSVEKKIVFDIGT